MVAHMAVHSWQPCAGLRLVHAQTRTAKHESTFVSEVDNIIKVQGQNLAS